MQHSKQIRSDGATRRVDVLRAAAGTENRRNAAPVDVVRNTSLGGEDFSLAAEDAFATPRGVSVVPAKFEYVSASIG